MKMKDLFTIALFALFLGLCGTELFTSVIAAINTTAQSVQYSSGIEQNTSSTTKQEKPAFNLDDILKETDLDG
ncbi:MAG: hypothetical protein R3Y11_00795 [Pseudomonadota bacterium]